MSLAASIINLSEFLAASAALTDDSEALTHESAALADCDALTAASSTADLTYDDSDSDDDDDTATAALEIADLAFNANSAAFEADSEEFGAALTLSDFMYTWLAFCAALSLRRPDQLYKSERNKRLKGMDFRKLKMKDYSLLHEAVDVLEFRTWIRKEIFHILDE